LNSSNHLVDNDFFGFGSSLNQNNLHLESTFQLEPSTFFNNTSTSALHEKNQFSTLPFAMLAANDGLSAQHPAATGGFLQGSSYQMGGQFNHYLGSNCRNSFDFIEMNGGNNLLEMNHVEPSNSKPQPYRVGGAYSMIESNGSSHVGVLAPQTQANSLVGNN
jgi:hypothetical protein